MRYVHSKRALSVLVAAFFSIPLLASDFYAAPNGSASGNGSRDKPWDLATALAQPSAVKPGDTVWLRGGTYTGAFTSSLTGSPGKPITLRQYPGERVTIDGNYGGNNPTLDIRGSNAWYWGFEVTNSNLTRISPTGDSPATRGVGVNLLGPATRLINVVIHDTGQGVLSTAAAPDAQVYGSLIYYNGYDGPDRGHGHGIYLQNDTGIKRIVDNILFAQFGYGIHAYTESSKLNNLYFEGNTSFNNGVLSQVSGASTNLLVGANGSAASDPNASEKVAKNDSLVGNMTYSSGSAGTSANLGYSKGIASPNIANNYLMGPTALALINAFRPISMSGNSLWGTISGFTSSEFPNNTYFANRPTGLKVFIRPNQFEPGRAQITVYNWDKLAAVDIDLKGLLTAGTAYELRNAQNFFGPAVLSGTYDGSTLHVPMNGLVPAAPIGRPAPAATGPDFQVFVVIPKPPASNAKPPVASLSFQPRLPVAGDAIAFTDRSSGVVTSRSWDFGDPASGAQNASSVPSPSHTFSGPGTYTVRLTVANDGGTSVRERDVTVTASPGTRASLLPVAGHVLGVGATFVTDVAIENPNANAVSAALVFTPSGGTSTDPAPLSLTAGETRTLADVVANQFGQQNAIGSLRLDTSGTPPAALRIVCRTYVQQGTGTLGLGTPGLDAAAATTGDRYLSNLTISDAFRTNVGAVNGSDAAVVFSLRLLDPNGNILGEVPLLLNPGEQRQWFLAQLFPAASGSGLTARLIPPSGSVSPSAYAAVTDNASSDPTYYPGIGPAPVQYIPGIAGVSGVGGAFFRSEISVANSGNGPATVTLTFLEHDRDNTAAPSTSLVLGPYETFHADDALTALFGVTATYGALRIESDVSPGVAVFERILTDATTTAGTVGQQVDAVSAEDLGPAGSVLGVRQDQAFRSNLGFLNPLAATAAIGLTLVRSPATKLATATVFVPPFGYVQRNIASLFPGTPLPAGENLSVAVNAGSTPVFAFASVIDNSSQDPTYYPEIP